MIISNEKQMHNWGRVPVVHFAQCGTRQFFEITVINLLITNLQNKVE